MKSWISFLLPTDEYKEKKMLHFFSEGAIVLLLFLIATLIGDRFITLDTQTVLLMHIAIFLLYVLVRYITSGIEFTNIATEKEYQKELKVIFVKAVVFIITFILVYLLISGFPDSLNDWLEVLGFSILAGLMMFFINFISLKRSYNKNKELS